MIARSDWVYQLEASPSGSRSTAETVPADSDPINCRLHTSTRAKSLMDTLYLLCGHYAVSLPYNKRQEETLVLHPHHFPSIYHVSYMSLADISADSANFEAYCDRFIRNNSRRNGTTGLRLGLSAHTLLRGTKCDACSPGYHVASSPEAFSPSERSPRH
ncbi:hypothetical protein KC321_g40 [Hortaea werneckii]|nr:hypothetical protein KC321_g40 [Hortaea werneckii]